VPHVGQKFNSDVGIAHGNDTGLLHAQDSHVDLRLTETTGRVDDSITLKAIGKRRNGGQSQANVCRDARYDEFLSPCCFNGAGDALIIPGVNRRAFNDRYAAQNIGEFRKSGPHHFSVVMVTTTGTLSASIARVRPTTLCLS